MEKKESNEMEVAEKTYEERKKKKKRKGRTIKFINS